MVRYANISRSKPVLEESFGWIDAERRSEVEADMILPLLSRLPVANGLSQSAASLARVLGPIIGGGLWSFSIAEKATSLGFNV